MRAVFAARRVPGWPRPCPGRRRSASRPAAPRAAPAESARGRLRRARPLANRRRHLSSASWSTRVQPLFLADRAGHPRGGFDEQRREQLVVRVGIAAQEADDPQPADRIVAAADGSPVAIAADEFAGRHDGSLQLQATTPMAPKRRVRPGDAPPCLARPHPQQLNCGCLPCAAGQPATPPSASRRPIPSRRR